MKTTSRNENLLHFAHQDSLFKKEYHSKQYNVPYLPNESYKDSENLLHSSIFSDSISLSSEIFCGCVIGNNEKHFEKESASLLINECSIDSQTSDDHFNISKRIQRNNRQNSEENQIIIKKQQNFQESNAVQERIKIEEESELSLTSSSIGNFSSEKSKIDSKEFIDRVIKSNNIIKNIIKQYYNYLMKESNSSLISEFIIEKPISYSKKLIKKYFKGIAYNNASLIKILKHEKYGKGLEYYLTFDAQEELQNSKVQNLEEHMQSIIFLKQCCVNHELLDSINFYKKRCKLPQI